MRFGGYAAPYATPMPNQKPDPEMEKQALKNQAEALQSELNFIKKRLAEIETVTAENQ
jgi:prefoldin subunit 5